MNFFRNDLKQSVADSVDKTDNRISFDIDRDSIQFGASETSNYAATPALISGVAPATSQTQMLENQAEYVATRPDAVIANMADSIVITQSNIANWGIGEGVGTGEIPDYLPTNSCGCGDCAQCNGSGTNGFNPNAATSTLVDLDQVVLLDFDSGTDGNINYTSDIRSAIVEQMTIVYENFGVEFVLEAPTEGDFSTLFFNAGTSGGLAEDIDFRNLNKNDNAIINIVGFGLIDSDAEIISASANIGAHELGHILGLRHHDAFGPIGSGIPGNLFFPGFAPEFTGPTNADETRNHIMNTPALAGTTGDVLTRSWLGEREAIKLAFSVLGTTVAESTAPNDSFQTAQAIELEEMIVPNTIIVGDNADAGDFNVEAISVVGSFSFVDSLDYYSFEGVEGRFYSFEVISNATNRYSDNDPIDPIISIYDSAFNLVDYYDSTAVNDDDVEFSFDSHILDLFLPESGTYFVEIDTFSNGDSGNYELFIQNVVAEPFVLDQPDDHSDIVLNETATRLEFEPVSNNVIARAEGIIGFIDTPVEQDVFSFTIDTSAKVIVDVRATFSFFNSFVTLLDSNQNQIAFNDDSSNPSLENATDSQFIVNDLPAGDYFVVVEGSNESTGSYRLGVRHNGALGNFDDHADSFVGSTRLSLNALPQTTFVNASAELGSDNDYFRFTAQTTGRMVVRSLGLSGDINTVLRAYNSNTDLIDANNNFNGSLDSRLSFNIIEGETYFVRLSTVQETSGDYRLSLRSIEGESVASTNSGAANGLTLGQTPGSAYEKYINLHFGQNNTLDYGAAFDAFLATSDLPIRQIDEFDGDRGLLAANV